MPGTRSSCNVPFELSMSGLPYLEVRKIPIGLTVPRFAPGYPIDMTSGECSFLTRHRTVVTNDHMDSTATNRPGSPRLRIQHFHVLRLQPLVERLHQRVVEVDAPVVAELHLDARSPVPIAHRDRARAVAVGFEQRLERRRGGRAGGGDLAVHRQPHSARKPAARAGDVVDPVGGDAREHGLALLARGTAHAAHLGLNYDDRILLDGIAVLVEHLVVYSDLLGGGAVRQVDDHHAAGLGFLEAYRFHHPGDKLGARPTFALRRSHEALQARPDEAPDLGAVGAERVAGEIKPEARLLLSQPLRLGPLRRGDERGFLLRSALARAEEAHLSCVALGLL